MTSYRAMNFVLVNCSRWALWCTLAATVGGASHAASTLIWPLNDTGMTQCLDLQSGGLGVPCAGTGQDGAFGRDVNKPGNGNGHAGFVFLKVCNSGSLAGDGSCPAKPKAGPGLDQWGCTLDKRSGLMWENKTTDGGLHDTRHSYTYDATERSGSAVDFAAEVNRQSLCGATDWRLPSASELGSLVDYGKPSWGLDPMIDATWFPNTGNSPYWSTDRCAGPVCNLGSAWVLRFSDASYYPTYSPNGRPFNYPVRLVRSPLNRPPVPDADRRFVFHGSQPTMTDTVTGLVWQRCSVGQVWQGTHCEGSATPLSWPDALKAAIQAGSGWRLPNIKELMSLVVFERFAPAVVGLVPTATTTRYLSSTPAVDEPGITHVWTVDVFSGTPSPYADALNLNAAVLVRDPH